MTEKKGFFFYKKRNMKKERFLKNEGKRDFEGKARLVVFKSFGGLKANTIQFVCFQSVF